MVNLYNSYELTNIPTAMQSNNDPSIIYVQMPAEVSRTVYLDC